MYVRGFHDNIVCCWRHKGTRLRELLCKLCNLRCNSCGHSAKRFERFGESDSNDSAYSVWKSEFPADIFQLTHTHVLNTNYYSVRCPKIRRKFSRKLRTRLQFTAILIKNHISSVWLFSKIIFTLIITVIPTHFTPWQNGFTTAKDQIKLKILY